MDAVVAAVSSMEDNPLFNSGKGAVFNVDGKVFHLRYLISILPQSFSLE
jgi:Asparaginase